MENKFFMHRIKRSGETWDKGIEIHDTYEVAKGAFYAYMGAYAYGRAQDENVNFVSCEITDMTGTRIINDTWIKPDPTHAVEVE